MYHIIIIIIVIVIPLVIVVGCNMSDGHALVVIVTGIFVENDTVTGAVISGADVVACRRLLLAFSCHLGLGDPSTMCCVVSCS